MARSSTSVSFDHEFDADPEQVVLVADAHMRYLAASAGACRVLGYTLTELLAMRVQEVVAETDAAERYRRMTEDGHQEGRITLIHKSGRRVEASYLAREARAGEFTYYVSHLTPLQPGAEPPTRMRVVVADDDPGSLLLMSTLLSFHGHVEVVGEAKDGVEAVQLVQERDPDLLLLDVQMPRLDGLAAAEMITSLRPTTHIVLHSGAADAEMKQRAEALHLRLLDKMDVEQVIETLLHPSPAEPAELLDGRIENAVLTALTARRTTPVIVVLADGAVPFYNSLAADLLGLPIDSRDTHIDRIVERYQVLRPHDQSPVDLDQRPVTQSARERKPIAETYLVRVDASKTLCRFTSLPFFDDDNEFLGAALYIEPVATFPDDD
jgi:PAS domain S-box-containing protein